MPLKHGRFGNCQVIVRTSESADNICVCKHVSVGIQTLNMWVHLCVDLSVSLGVENRPKFRGFATPVLIEQRKQIQLYKIVN